MKEIGKTLKEKRGYMNLSLSDVHKATKIQEKYLAAIEEGDLRVFKAEVYYKSFLRSYSKYLGFDAEEFVELFNAQKREIEESSKLEESSLNDSKNIFYIKKIFIVIAAIVTIALAATFICLYKRMSNIFQSDTTKQVEDQNFPDQLEQGDDVVVTMQPSGIVFKDNASSAKVLTKQNLEIEAKETVWIKVDIDGKTAYEATLPKGTRKVWEADKLFTLRVGYAPGVKVFFNGEVVDIISGSVQDVNTVVLKKKQA
jgi:cytoskeletal protein RodZ